jgi:hypothetical protein
VQAISKNNNCKRQKSLLKYGQDQWGNGLPKFIVPVRYARFGDAREQNCGSIF